MSHVLFWILALATCGGALGVVVERNVVRMAFWLIVSLGSVAGLFFLLGADFVGATQLLIYVGGTVVLLIFGVMLTATGPLSRTTTVLRGERLLAAVIGASLLSVISVSVLAVDWSDHTAGSDAYAQGNTTRSLGLMLLGLDAQRLTNGISEQTANARHDEALSETPLIGDASGVGYLLPFEIASIHLLVVLIGAAYLARAERRRATSIGSPSDRERRAT